MGAPHDPPAPGWRHSVFWKVAGTLVGGQLALGLLAVGLTAWFAYDRGLDLVENSLRQRLDAVAEEVERRTGQALVDGIDRMGPAMRLDLAQRFPDPVFLLDPEGEVQAGPSENQSVPAVPESARVALAVGNVGVHLGRPLATQSWGVTPVFDADGLLAGGLLVYPMEASVEEELAGTRAAFERTVGVVALLAFLTALLLGTVLTWRLVRPLRRMTHRVEAIRAGEYAGRVETRSLDELGRLGTAINHMAQAVEQSITSLQATDQLRRELVANMGHDLRTPLAALLGYAEEAERHIVAGNPEDAAEALETVRRQGRYIQHLVGDLFELSVLDQGGPELRREPVPLSELVHDAARRHRRPMDEAGIALHVDVPPNLPLVYGDGVRLLRVLDNLLSNACRHTPEGGAVHLTATGGPEGVAVAVRDTGAGMTADVVAHVFERYYKGSGARTRKDGTTGLGLAISRAIARAHGGTLTATSTPGVGSVFTLRLPVSGP